MQHGKKYEDLVKELETVRKEKEAFLLQIGHLSTELENTNKELEISRKAVAEATKDSDSVKDSRVGHIDL